MTFEIYKRGQGNAARLVTGLGSLAVAGFGCWALRNYLATDTKWHGLDPAMLVGFTAFVVCTAAIAWLVLMTHGIVDFLILTEAELRKVSWPTKRDLYQQTVVVIVVSVMLGIMILVVDLMLSNILHLAKLY
jgi:preprotein translocase subunit SecE